MQQKTYFIFQQKPKREIISSNAKIFIEKI